MQPIVLIEVVCNLCVCQLHSILSVIETTITVITLHGVFERWLFFTHYLEINDSNVAEKRSKWKEMWEHYSFASKVNKEDGDVQVPMLLTAIGPEVRSL